ncbi:hypothetical protein JTB14_010255 [Gonioctena quinquepunctata]|nr:hypothetical protein JTB14_010255 [Gonioctena quinquepunctata]
MDPPSPENYEIFSGAVIRPAKKSIPSGFREEYIPGWNERSEELHNQFLESSDQEIADELLHTLDAARRENWMRTVENLDFENQAEWLGAFYASSAELE